jgi:DNA mismatch repair protein MutS2
VQIGNLRAQAAVGEVLLDRPGSGRPRAAAGGERRSAGRNGNGGGTPSVHPSGGGAREAPLRTADATLDLRGERVDDALRAVDRYLDESLMAARPVIYVVHGHGTGALRSAVRAHLGAHPAVSNLRPGEDGEGGDGVTIAWLDV